MYDVRVHKPCALPESYKSMGPSSWFGRAESAGLEQERQQSPSPAVAYRGLYALTVRWQPPVPRGDAPQRRDSSSLPKDPRQWSREDVAVWLVHVMDLHRLPAVSTDRFLMNGKALCLMTMEMFVQRVPLGGKLLYKDFQLRLSSVLYNGP